MELVARGIPGRPPPEVQLSIFNVTAVSNLDFLRGFSVSIASQAAPESGLDL